MFSPTAHSPSPHTNAHSLARTAGADAGHTRIAPAQPRRAFVVWHDWSSGRAEERRIAGLPRLSRTVGLTRSY